MDTPTPLIHAKLPAILAAVKAITKDRKNEQQNFKFRGVDDVYNALHDLFAEHQVYVLPEILEWKQADRPTAKGGLQIHTVVKMRYRFVAIDGSERITETPGEAADTGDKGLGKACQYAYKLALLQMFLVPTEGDNDPDAHAVEWGARQQAAPRQPQRPARQEQPAERVPPGFPEPGMVDWLKRIQEASNESSLDGIRAELIAAQDAGHAPKGPAGKAVKAAMDLRRDELKRAKP